jgi:hypothetical protein
MSRGIHPCRSSSGKIGHSVRSRHHRPLACFTRLRADIDGERRYALFAATRFSFGPDQTRAPARTGGTPSISARPGCIKWVQQRRIGVLVQSATSDRTANRLLEPVAHYGERAGNSVRNPLSAIPFAQCVETLGRHSDQLGMLYWLQRNAFCRACTSAPL